MEVPAYRMYVDEVGNPDMGSCDNPNHQYLSLTGVIINKDHARTIIQPQMEDLKCRYFDSHPDDPVIFHRKEVLNAKPPFERLADESIRNKFNAELIAMLTTWPYAVISVCIDKKQHRDTYTTWHYHPYHYCLMVLLERFVMFMRRRNIHGDVLAEARGSQEDMKLKDSFRRLCKSGTSYVSADNISQALTSGELKVKPKDRNIAGLQLADILAHPSRNEILKENGLWTKEIAPFAQEIIKILKGKYDTINGRCVGKKLLP